MSGFGGFCVGFFLGGGAVFLSFFFSIDKHRFLNNFFSFLAARDPTVVNLSDLRHRKCLSARRRYGRTCQH